MFSVLEQQHIGFEYILIDGGSKDGSVDLIRKYADKLAHFVSEADNGIYHAFNKGLALAQGDIIGFLNADDFYTNHFVLQAVARVFEQEDCDAVYADLVYVDQTDSSLIKRYWHAGNYRHGAFCRGWMPPHPTLFVRRTVYERLGYFRTDFVSAADYELMLRFIHKNRIKTAYLPRVIIKMRQGGISNASFANRLRANKEDQMAWQVNQLRMPPLLPLLKPLRKIPQFFYKVRHIEPLLPQP